MIKKRDPTKISQSNFLIKISLHTSYQYHNEKIIFLILCILIIVSIKITFKYNLILTSIIIYCLNVCECDEMMKFSEMCPKNLLEQLNKSNL